MSSKIRITIASNLDGPDESVAIGFLLYSSQFDSLEKR